MTKHKTLYSVFIAPQINEMRQKGFFRSLKIKYPNIPDYVRHELYRVHHNSEDINDVSSNQQYIEEFFTVANSKKWKLQKIDLHLSKLSADTKHNFIERKFGIENPYEVPNDAERMERQIKAINPTDNEPVIFFNEPDGLDLQEGYHRTMSRILYGSGDIATAQNNIINAKNAVEIKKIALSWKPVKTKAWIGY